MIKEKFKIELSQDVLRLDDKNEATKAEFPKAFGKKNKNNFISSSDNEAILTITTPASKTIADAFYKLEEITNVVYSEIYKLKETIYPFSKFEDLELSGRVAIIINGENYEELKKINKKLPSTLKEAISNAKHSFKNVKHIIEPLYGKVGFVVKKDRFELTNVKKNYNSRFGFTIDDATILVTFILSLLENGSDIQEDEVISNLEKIDKFYNLKDKEIFKNVKKYLSTSRDEDKLSDKEKQDLIAKYMEEGYETRYALVGRSIKKEKESVCLIKQAIKLGIDFNIVNDDKDIVELNLNGHREFVVEGNRTSRDHYILSMLADDKMTSKNLMEEYGLSVPEATLLDYRSDEDDINDAAEKYKGKKIVVKPRNTNYGDGITVFDKPATKKAILKAIKYAYTFDADILIEEYKAGMEYRFLVVDGKCISVCNRRAASVLGDGKSTVRELIEKVNQTYWHRYVGDEIRIDELGKDYLKLKDYTYDSVIPAGERVYIRKNTNVSSGGDAFDCTEEMPEYFKQVAVKAGEPLNAKIVGVDLIINDINKEEYSIIEINDNPGYSINEWPTDGKEKPIALAILKLIDLVK